MTLAAVVAASVALLVGLYLWSRAPDYKVLFSNLADRDAGTVTASLQQMKSPIRPKPTAPSWCLRIRSTIALQTGRAKACPRAARWVFETLDNAKLG